MNPGPADGLVSEVRIVRWTHGQGVGTTDRVAVEEPLEIRVDSHPVVVTMRTPGHDEELAAGFLATERVLARPSDIAAMRPYPRNDAGNVLDVFLSDGVSVDLRRLARNVYAASSCGICGKAAIDAVRVECPAVGPGPRIGAGLLSAFPGILRAAQPAFGVTGGLHGAALFDADGTLLFAREDVGRHNAVDKVLGRAWLDGLWPLDRHVLQVSGRTSFEILQKALAAGVAVVAGISAPTSLAVRFAEESGQTLVGFMDKAGFNVYGHPSRIT